MAMIRAAVAIFFGGTAKFGHCDEHDVLHAVTKVLPEGGQRLS
jgi:hypothetical protein